MSQVDINRMRKAAKAIFLATEEPIANNLSQLLNQAADEIEEYRKTHLKWELFNGQKLHVGDLVICEGFGPAYITSDTANNPEAFEGIITRKGDVIGPWSADFSCFDSTTGILSNFEGEQFSKILKVLKLSF